MADLDIPDEARPHVAAELDRLAEVIQEDPDYPVSTALDVLVAMANRASELRGDGRG